MTLYTEFAPAERADAQAIERDRRLFETFPQLVPFLDAMPTMCLVLNRQRQAVFANRASFTTLNIPAEQVYGQRPGELLNCANAFINPGGCGTSPFCRTCGAVNSILSSLNGHKDVQECRITQRDGAALDLRAWAEPFEWEGERYSIFVVEDIGPEKRRRALERIFFHDVLNTAGVIVGYTAAIQDGMIDPSQEHAETLYRQARRLVAEIEEQRDLAYAEQNDLISRESQADTLELLRDVQATSLFLKQAQRRSLIVAPLAQTAPFVTDTRLVSRVLGNMIKNALEACHEEQTVTLNCQIVDGNVIYSVHNPSVMPEDVRMQIFKRSFSTKGAGRGLGTYSMKLLTERYLGGSVWFESMPGNGTTFYARYPLVWWGGGEGGSASG